MCGITGLVTLGRPSDAVLKSMTAALHHRGPDDSGFYCDSMAALGHRRLSIIDVAAGSQPMSNESREIWITYNGEIFNHTWLRRDLEQAGHQYKSHCDTETIIHAYEEYGSECVKRFRGMFAFGLWDREARTLFCARDPMGIKPFYYFWDGRLFAFASEIKALLRHPAISATLNEELLPEYLGFGYTSGEDTLFSGIRKLMPGHHLTLRLDTPSPSLRVAPYWEVPEPTAADAESDQFWIRGCRRHLEVAVQTHLMSDVPLGTFLSGGVDCSAIAALMTDMVPGPIETFAVGYREAAFSELPYARQVSSALGTNHHEVVIGMEDVFNALPRLIWHEDEPIAWPSSIAHYFVSQLASRHVKVVLTGDGSDELFGGYERYGHYLFNHRWMSLYRGIPAIWRSWVRGRLADSPLLSAPLRRKLRHTFVGRENTLESLQLDNFYCAFSMADQRRLLSKPAPDLSITYRNFKHYWDARPQSSLLDRMLFADQKTYLVELLMKQDQMSMACSIESRVPFLDHPLVEFAARVPAHLKVKGSISKYVLKKAVEDLLPAEIINRKKMGFPTPMRQWLRDPGAADLFAMLRDPDGVLASYLDMREVDSLLDRHERGREDATDRIWRLLNLQLWGKIFLAGDSSQDAMAPMAGSDQVQYRSL